MRFSDNYKMWGAVPALLLALLAMGYWLHEQQEVEDRHQQEVLSRADTLVASITDRFSQLHGLSRALRGMVEVHGLPSVDAYRAYLTTLQISNRDLGVHALALVSYVPGEKVGPHVQHLQALGHRTYGVRPPGFRAFHAPLSLIEPGTPANQARIGFDVATDAKLLPALLRSGDSSESVLSDRLQLEQGAGLPLQPAYDLYTPIYRSGSPLVSVEERRKALIGWVALTFRVQDLLDGLHALPSGPLAFALHTGGGQGETSLLYASPLLSQNPFSAFTVKQARKLAIDGQEWHLTLYQGPAPTPMELQTHDLIASLGLVAATLVGSLLWVLGAGRARAHLETHRAMAEQSRTEENFRGLVEAIPDLMFEFDADGRYQQFQGPKNSLLYAAPEAFLGRSVEEVLPPAAARTCMQALREARLHGVSSGQQIELPIGEEMHWFELSTAVKASDTGAQRFVMLSRDITPRKHLELQLQAGREQLLLAVQSADIGLWDWDFGSGSLSVNDQWCSMLGLVPGQQEINMDLWTSLVHPADLAQLEEVVREVIFDRHRRDYSVEIRARHADGHYVWLLDRGRILQRDARDLPVRIMGSHIDISVQKQAQERLKVSAHALTASTQGIVITNVTGAVQSVNPAFCQMTGYPEAELMGRNCSLLQGPQTDPATVKRISDALAEGANFFGLLLNYRKSGATFWNELQITPIREGGQITHFVGVSRDVTDRVRAEQQREADRAAIQESHRLLRKLSQRLHTAQEDERRRVAHELHDDLGQTLTALKISLQTSARLPAATAEKAISDQVHMVENAIVQVRHLALALRPSMLDDLGLAAALRWLTTSASVNRGVVVEFSEVMDRPRVDPDVETACFRIVQEALTNVRRHAHAKHVRVHLSVQHGQLTLKIEDDGRGFDTSALDALRSNKPSLGLLGMHERAAGIGASLELTSQLGQGCTITLRCALSETTEEEEL